MRPRLIGGNEPGSHAGTGRTLIKYRGECGPVADPARSEHRYIQVAEHRLEQGYQRNLPADMPARFNALNDDNVATGISSGPGLLQGTDLPASQRPVPMSEFHQLRVWIRPEEVNYPHPRSCRFHSLAIDIFGQEIGRQHPTRPCRHCGQNFVESGSALP